MSLKLIINGQYTIFDTEEDLIKHNGRIANGVMASVTAKVIRIKGAPSYRRGMVKLSARPDKITSFSIGGAEFFLDNVTWRPE